MFPEQGPLEIDLDCIIRLGFLFFLQHRANIFYGTQRYHLRLVKLVNLSLHYSYVNGARRRLVPDVGTNNTNKPYRY